MDQNLARPQTRVVTRLNEVREQIRSMTATQVREFMAKRGWHSDDSMTPFGWGNDAQGNPAWGYSIWFTRWDWHGVRCDKRTFGSHTRSVDPDRIDDAVRLAAETALQAWTAFTDLLPGSANIYGVIDPEISTIQEMWRSTPGFDDLFMKGDEYGD